MCERSQSSKKQYMRLLTPSPFFCICVDPWHLLAWLHVRVLAREHKNDAMSVAYRRFIVNCFRKALEGKSLPYTFSRTASVLGRAEPLVCPGELL
jgi:hypothetical protein